MAAWSDTPKRAEQEKQAEQVEITFREILCQLGQALKDLSKDLMRLPSEIWGKFQDQ